MKSKRAVKKMMRVMKNILLWMHDQSLANKLVFLFVTILALPIIAFGSYYLEIVKDSNQKEVFNSSQKFIRLVGFNVERNSEICRRVAQIVISENQFIEFLATKNDIEPEELIRFDRETLKNIVNIQSANLDVYNIRFFSDRDDFLEIWPLVYDERRIRNNEWFKNMKNGRKKFYWQFNHLEESFRTNVTDINEVVSLFWDVERYGKHVGTLEINMQTNVFFSEMYDNGFDNNISCVSVINGQNDLIFNKDNNFYKKLASGNMTFLKQKLIDNIIGDEGCFTFKFDKENLICAYVSVKSIDSKMILITSNNKLVSKLNQARNWVLLGTIGIIMVLSGIVYVFLSIMLKKLRIIIATMRKVQEGNLNVEIPISGNDQIGEMAFHFRKMLGKINQLIDVINKKHAAEKNAEIRALQSQINAHFIHNVLEAIRMMAEIKNESEISETVTCLGSLMKYSMNWDRQHVLLRDEIDYVKDFIYLTNVRFDSKVKLIINIDETLLEYKVFKMLLQPIVENAVIHGIRRKHGDSILSLTARVEEEVLFIEITDNGVGITSSTLDNIIRSIEIDRFEDEVCNKTNGIGLKNVSDRLKLLFGKEYGLDIASKENTYTTVSLKLPYQKGQGC